MGIYQISSIEDGDRFNWSIGSTYTGPTNYANATDTTGLGQPIVVTNNLPNPSSGQNS